MTFEYVEESSFALIQQQYDQFVTKCRVTCRIHSEDEILMLPFGSTLT